MKDGGGKLAYAPADFYVGAGAAALYLGSLIDAAPWNVVPSCFAGRMHVGDPGPLNPEINPILKATSDVEWRRMVKALFDRRDDVAAMLPEWLPAELQGMPLTEHGGTAWPWPWPSSAQTAWVYAWTNDGLVVTHYGRICPQFRERWSWIAVGPEHDRTHQGTVRWPVMVPNPARTTVLQRGGGEPEGSDSAIG